MILNYLIIPLMFRIIYSERRHGTTYLSKLLGSRSDSISFFEGFNKKNGMFYCQDQLTDSNFDFPSFINQRIEAHPWAQKPYKYLKILKIHEPYFQLLLEHQLIDGIIFLRRDPNASYASLVRALTNGDWSANPAERMENQKKGTSGYINIQAIPDEAKYHRQLKNWFNKGLQAAEQHRIPFTVLSFKELTSPEFNATTLVEKLFHDPS